MQDMRDINPSGAGEGVFLLSLARQFQRRGNLLPFRVAIPRGQAAKEVVIGLGGDVGVIVGMSHEIFESRARSASRLMQLAGQRWYQSHMTVVIARFLKGRRHPSPDRSPSG
jgi:hypothetical protein